MRTGATGGISTQMTRSLSGLRMVAVRTRFPGCNRHQGAVESRAPGRSRHEDSDRLRLALGDAQAQRARTPRFLSGRRPRRARARRRHRHVCKCLVICRAGTPPLARDLRSRQPRVLLLADPRTHRRRLEDQGQAVPGPALPHRRGRDGRRRALLGRAVVLGPVRAAR